MYRTDIDTYKPVHVDDPNEFVTVSANDSSKVAANFTAKEFYNSRIGKPHLMSKQVIRCAQIIRDWAGIPTEINSSYRNYVPTGGATHSPHMMAMGVDLDFFEVAKEEELLIRVRDDFDQKGELFQALWAAGCRGFGVYDGFVHIDTVPVELYEVFKAKRGAKYNGEQYAYWNHQKTLRNKKIDYGSTDSVVEPSLPDKITGIVEGMVEEINSDDGMESGMAWLIAAIFTLTSLGLIAWLISYING